MLSTLANVDRSSWVSWAAYTVGIQLAGVHQLRADIGSGGGGVGLLLITVAIFLVLVLTIQRHMRLSLLAQSFGTPRQLVTTRWFRYSRNPIYVAFLIPLSAIAVFSPFAALVAIALYLTAMTKFVILEEEATLEASFGDAFRAYRRRTPRWLLVL